MSTKKDPFQQGPVLRSNTKNRPPIQPMQEVLQRNKSVSKQAEKPFAQSLQLVPIETLVSSRFQERDELNAVEDREYQQLVTQIRADLEALDHSDVRTIQHVFIVMPDEKHDGKFVLARGGHRRLQACLDLDVKSVYIWERPFDEEVLATGTYTENKGRKKTSWLEDGRMFKNMMENLGWTQSQLAQHLHVEGGQSHVSRCLAMLSYHPDIQRMLALSEERGMRASKELARLEKHFGSEKARELWTPLIASFLNGELLTDDIEKKVKQLVGEDPTTISSRETRDIPALRSKRLVKSVYTKWKSFRTEVRYNELDEEAKLEVENIYKEMGEFIGRPL